MAIDYIMLDKESYTLALNACCITLGDKYVEKDLIRRGLFFGKKAQTPEHTQSISIWNSFWLVRDKLEEIVNRDESIMLPKNASGFDIMEAMELHECSAYVTHDELETISNNSNAYENFETELRSQYRRCAKERKIHLRKAWYRKLGISDVELTGATLFCAYHLVQEAGIQVVQFVERVKRLGELCKHV